MPPLVALKHEYKQKWNPLYKLGMKPSTEIKNSCATINPGYKTKSQSIKRTALSRLKAIESQEFSEATYS